MSSRQEPKQLLFEQLAVIARALGSAARLELLDFLAQGERNVEDLATADPSGIDIALFSAGGGRSKEFACPG